jgi:membrane protease YdiL (CAAX protease family)
MLFPGLLTWVYFVALAHSDPRLQQLAYGVGKTLQFAFPVVWITLVRRERVRFAWPRMAGLPMGLGFGLLVLAAALAGYHLVLEPAGLLAAAAAMIREKIANFHIRSSGGFLAMGVFYCVVHSFLEEYYWRWFVFGQLRRLMPPGAAMVVSAVGFTLHHVLVLGFYFGLFSWPTLLFSLAVTVGGVFWAWLYQRSGSLYGPWLSHLLVDAAIFLVGYDLVRPWLT